MSTPLTSHRRSFSLISRSSGSGPIFSPQTRRSLTGRDIESSAASVNASPQLPDVGNEDDFRARREKRRSRTLAQTAGSPRARPVEENQGETAKLTNDQLATHYINCIKLSTENKITAKNAFNLHLIDHMNEMLKQRCEGTMNFQMAGGTIFASAKIYASRVDAVHSEAYKVLSSLGRGSTDEKNEVESSEVEPESREPGKKKKKRSKILESNSSALRLKKLDVNWRTDPLDQYHASIFDVASTSGLLVNHLSLCKDGITLRFDSDMESPLTHNVCGGGKPTSAADSEEQQNAPINEDLKQEIDGMFAELVNLSNGANTNKATVCPTLVDFKWIDRENSFEWHEDELLEANEDSSPAHSATVASTHEFDDIIMDAESCPDDEQPVSVVDIDETKAEPSDGIGPFPVPMDAELLTSFMPGEYSYFKPGALSTWEGPNHWKMRVKASKPPASVAGTEKTSGSDQAAKGKKRKRNLYIDYSKVNTDTKDFEPAKKSQVITKRILEKLRKSEEDRLLPTADEYNVLDLAKCVLQPDVQIRPVTLIRGSKQVSHIPQLDSDRLAAYNYDNPNDKYNYCPNMTDDEEALADDGDEVGDIPADFAHCDYNGTDHVDGFPDMTLSQTQNMTQNSQFDIEAMLQGDHLVSQPKKVQKISIAYAKKATRIDVRRLKAAMWTLLHKNEGNTTESVHAETGVHGRSMQNSLASDTSIANLLSSVTEQKTFSCMYQTLPKLMPTTMAENLSIPLAFTCLLHLANEKSLKIEANPDMSDLNIMEPLTEIV